MRKALKYCLCQKQTVAMAELGATGATLEMKGGTGGEALAAWGTFMAIGELFSELLP